MQEDNYVVFTNDLIHIAFRKNPLQMVGSYMCGMMNLSDNFRLFNEKNEVALLSVSIPQTQSNFEV